MTLVIGAVANGKTWLVGDSYCGNEMAIELCNSKVSLLGGKLGMGASGNIIDETIMRNSLSHLISKKKTLTATWLVNTLPLLLIKHIKQKYGDLMAHRESPGPSEWLLAHKDKLYYLDPNLAVWSPSLPYAAVGAGSVMALSVLSFAHTQGLLDKDPKGTLMSVMQSCAQHSPYVRGPFTIIEVK